MRLSTQKHVAKSRCAKGQHDPGLALRARIDAPRGATYNSESLMQVAPNVEVVNAFTTYACRNCGQPC